MVSDILIAVKDGLWTIPCFLEEIEDLFYASVV